MTARRSYKKHGFHFRCECCNAFLNPQYQVIGLCSICNRITRKAATPEYIAEDNAFVEHILWRNPMDGGLVSERESAEDDYQGYGDD